MMHHHTIYQGWIRTEISQQLTISIGILLSNKMRVCERERCWRAWKFIVEGRKEKQFWLVEEKLASLTETRE